MSQRQIQELKELVELQRQRIETMGNAISSVLDMWPGSYVPKGLRLELLQAVGLAPPTKPASTKEKLDRLLELMDKLMPDNCTPNTRAVVARLVDAIDRALCTSVPLGPSNRDCLVDAFSHGMDLLTELAKLEQAEPRSPQKEAELAKLLEVEERVAKLEDKDSKYLKDLASLRCRCYQVSRKQEVQLSNLEGLDPEGKLRDTVKGMVDAIDRALVHGGLRRNRNRLVEAHSDGLALLAELGRRSPRGRG